MPRNPYTIILFSRTEFFLFLFQPQVPLQLPCYDFITVTYQTLKILSKVFKSNKLPQCDGRYVQGLVTYSP